ncbi:hypothetical protein BB561_001574 [Smittium simulii]|uniref:Uncharacterized protein n=1 Tax=Smittium simulii TaxID=133385 RepID=A0A2T9YTY6_9FUNG|nr:hypothetical protein BB561_001574 [Smittium simulii]
MFGVAILKSRKPIFTLIAKTPDLRTIAALTQEDAVICYFVKSIVLTYAIKPKILAGFLLALINHPKV